MTNLESIEKLRNWTADEHTLYRGLEMETFTGKLTSYERQKLDRIVNDLEAEIAEKYMELPVDAEGVPIHVGDEVIVDFEPPRRVVAVTSNEIVMTGYSYPCTGEQMNRFGIAKAYRHVKPRTVEDVLNELLDDYMNDVHRNDEDIIAKYAAELQMRGGVE